MGSGTGAAFRIPNSSVQIGDRSNILLEGAGRDNYDSSGYFPAAQRHTARATLNRFSPRMARTSCSA